MRLRILVTNDEGTVLYERRLVRAGKTFDGVVKVRDLIDAGYGRPNDKEKLE